MTTLNRLSSATSHKSWQPMVRGYICADQFSITREANYPTIGGSV
jgi:hypothetical protein